MQLDPVRKVLQDHLWKRGISLAEASVAISRNKTYLQQYLARGMPRVLSHHDSATLGELLDCDPDLLRHAEIPRAGRRPAFPARPTGPQWRSRTPPGRAPRPGSPTGSGRAGRSPKP